MNERTHGGKMDNIFKEVDKEALDKYIVMLPKYGESWREMPIHQLQRKLQEETAELLEGKDLLEIHREALDVINVARMIAERTKDA